MSNETIISALSRVAVLSGLTLAQLAELARRAERVTYRPGDFLIEEGRIGDAAILVVSGRTLRVSGPELPYRADVVPPGSFLAEMAMLIEVEHSSTVIAGAPVRALRLLRCELQEQMSRDSTLADHFVSVISRRLSSLAGELRKIDDTLTAPVPSIPSLAMARTMAPAALAAALH